MTIADTADPFSKVYAAIWDMLESNAEFCRLVKEGNRIKFDGVNRDPIKGQITDSDFPEVRIVPTGGETNLENTSGSGSITKNFDIQVSTGDQRLPYRLFPVEWCILKASLSWWEKIKSLTWQDQLFVRDARPVSISEGVSEADLNRGIKGWATVLSFTVEMQFHTATMKAG